MFQARLILHILISARYNYIIWIQDLLDSSSDGYTDDYDADREVVGLDMFADMILPCPVSQC